MNPLQEIVERENSLERNDQFRIQHEPLRLQIQQQVDDFGEVARQRLPALGPQLQSVTVAECEAAEPIPLRLILPYRTDRQLLHELRLHGRVLNRQRQAHSSSSSRKRPESLNSGSHRSPCFRTRPG